MSVRISKGSIDNKSNNSNNNYDRSDRENNTDNTNNSNTSYSILPNFSYLPNMFSIFRNFNLNFNMTLPVTMIRDAFCQYTTVIGNSFAFVNNINYMNQYLYHSMMNMFKSTFSGLIDTTGITAVGSWLSQCLTMNFEKIQQGEAMLKFLEGLIRDGVALVEQEALRGDKKYGEITSTNSGRKSISNINSNSNKFHTHTDLQLPEDVKNKVKEYFSTKNSNKSTTDSTPNCSNNPSNKRLPKFQLKKVINYDSLPLINFETLLPKRRIGKMDISHRMKKILKYKLKMYKHRFNTPIQRKFPGRSKIAQKKVRVRGRFVKQKKIFIVS